MSVISGKLRNYARNAIVQGVMANSVGQALNIVSRLALPPLFLHYWGAPVYGEWLLLTTMAVYVSLVDLGGQLYVVNKLTYHFAKGETREFSNVLHTSLAVFIAGPVAALILIIIMTNIVPFTEWFKILLFETSTARLVIIFFSAQILFSLPQGILLGIYRAIGMLPRSVMLGNILILMQILFYVLGLYSGLKISNVAALQVIPTIIIFFIALIDLRKKLPEITIFPLYDATLKTAVSFIKPSLHFFSIQLSQSLKIQGIILIVGYVFGSVQVVVYSTMRTMVGMITQIVSVITHSAWPELTKFDAINDQRKLARLFRAILRSSMVLTGILVAGLYHYGEDLHRIWLKGSVEFNKSLMVVLLLYLFQSMFWTVCSHLLMAINKHIKLANTLVFTGVLSIALGYIGGLKIGIEGVVIGVLTAEVLTVLWYIPYELNNYSKEFTITYFLIETMPVVTGTILASINKIVMIPLLAISLIWLWRSFSNTGKTATVNQKG